jgi:YfiH family protein
MSLRASFDAQALDWLVADWHGVERVRGFATTRNGPSGTAFDLGPARFDALEPSRRQAVLANRAALRRFLPSTPVWLEQVHGRDVVTLAAGSLDRARCDPPVADAAVTRVRNVPLGIRIADCLPVLLVDDDATVVAAAHAGWRGLAGGVLEATIDAMDARPSRIVAWLGPAIGAAAFEVGDDVLDAFTARDADAATFFRRHRDRKWIADLPALARHCLARAGVVRVTSGSPCTFSEPDRFFSWRRDRTPARQAALAWLDG